MIGRRTLLMGVSGLAVAAAWFAGRGNPRAAEPAVFRVGHTDEEWRRLLTPVQYAILRREGTEPAGSSPLDHEFRPGRYDCVGCAQPLFTGASKFNSGTGWPSFWQPLLGAVVTSTDTSLFTSRTAVRCSNCGGHLGHVFADGPQPTGLRYCMNGAVLAFHAETA